MAKRHEGGDHGLAGVGPGAPWNAAKNLPNFVDLDWRRRYLLLEHAGDGRIERRQLLQAGLIDDRRAASAVSSL